MLPYPTPIADCIERCAAAMTSTETRESAEKAADCSMALLYCAEIIREFEVEAVIPSRGKSYLALPRGLLSGMLISTPFWIAVFLLLR